MGFDIVIRDGRIYDGTGNSWFKADIVIFDPEKVANRATYGNPLQCPEGIAYVIVNGQIAVDRGRHTGALAGRALKHRDQ